ncbi:hypothetical protein F442_01216 [Phytophthora nicotianae P10297]|uniref:Uncharacterized protein n=2 Tax=Phytophthora nicotianae TaxID=4792 RepID=W2RJY8_PHYN3|nr:hypothetical protein PPTG_01087 [Phytophthora nicotianae INRA-310]ETN24925.1 hypothetical protein PPTG_01087 [Phytophthora nicotianae INRA-310]ETP53935.1 hypothetical protein F442_01216 [Phytophthora nicotianae P10297]
MERRMDAALQQIEQEASLRTDRHIQVMREDMHKYVEDRFQVAIRRSDDTALALVREELKTRRADHHDPITRSEHGLSSWSEGSWKSTIALQGSVKNRSAKRSQIVLRRGFATRW